MTRKTKSIIALICSIWFVLFGWGWTYFMNVVLVFPIAIAGFFLWRKSKPEPEDLIYKITGSLFLIGVVATIAALFLYS